MNDGIFFFFVTGQEFWNKEKNMCIIEIKFEKKLSRKMCQDNCVNQECIWPVRAAAGH